MVRDTDNITFSAEFFGCATQPAADSGMVQCGWPALHPHGKDFRAHSVKWRKMTIEVGYAESVCRYSRFNAEGHRKASTVLLMNN